MQKCFSLCNVHLVKCNEKDATCPFVKWLDNRFSIKANVTGRHNSRLGPVSEIDTTNALFSSSTQNSSINTE